MQSEEPKKSLANELKKENQKLREKLEEYKSLEEDLMARRVHEKVKKLLISSFTIGGIVLAIIGFVGLRGIRDYARDLAAEKIEEHINEEKIAEIATEAVQQNITALIGEQREDLEAQLWVYAREQINLIVTPIGGRATQLVSAELTERRLDLTPSMTPVRHQGAEGSVVGFAVAAALEYHIYKKLGKQVVISPRHLYYHAKLEGGFDPHADTGAHIKDAIKVLTTRGAVSEGVWPYKAGDLKSKPPEALKTAERYKAAESYKLTGIEEIKSAARQYGPVIAGMTIYESFLSKDVSETGRIPNPTPGEKIMGGHAICIVGYDDDEKSIKFKNSWGTKWGDEGYGSFSYSYAERYLSDIWTFTL